MKHILKGNNLSVIIVLLVMLQGCNPDNNPGEKEAKLVIENHFRKEVYKGYVEVLSVDVIRQAPGSFDDVQYYDMKLNVKVNINKAFVVSRLFTAVNFEVNEQWAENFANSMAQAQTQEQKDQIIKRFEANSFSEGTHEIEVAISFVKIEDRWTVLNLAMWPLKQGADSTSGGAAQ